MQNHQISLHSEMGEIQKKALNKASPRDFAVCHASLEREHKTSEHVAAEQQQVDKLLSRKEAAHYLNIAPQTLACWWTNKRYSLPLVKIGRHVKYRQSDLDAFIARNTFGTEVLQ